MQATIYPTVLPTNDPQNIPAQPNCCSPLSMKIAILAAIVLSGILIASALILGGIISLALPVVALKIIIAITAILIVRLAICIKDIRWEHLPIELLEQELEKEISSYSLATKPVNNQDPLNTAERYALRYWSNDHYTEMNAVAAREKTCWRVIDSVFNMRTRCINRIAIHALSKLPPFPTNKPLFRGAELSDGEINKLYQEGKVHQLDRFMSTSATAGLNFQGNVVYVIHSKSGKNIKSYSAVPGEEEVLFAPGCKFHVLKVEPCNEGGTFIEMNEI